MFDKILSTLRCSDCHGDICIKENKYLCVLCNRIFETNNRVLNTMPRNVMRFPLIYQDENLIQWHKMLDESQDYFYKSNKLVAWVQNAGHRTVKKWMKNYRCTSVLDLGCGDGAHLEHMGIFDSYIGLDVDTVSLERFADRAVRLSANIFALQGDAYCLPFKKGSFDAIISIYNLEHLVYLDLCLEEMHRVLTPKGTLFVSFPNEGGVAWKFGRRLTSRNYFQKKGLDYDRIMDIEHINCCWQIEKALKRHFKIIKTSRFPMPLISKNFSLITTMRCKK